MKILLRNITLILLVTLLNRFPLYGEEAKDSKNEFAGEFSAYGVKVPLGNYYFVKQAISVFGSRFGEAASTAEQLEDRVWTQLLLSYEAFRRNITVTAAELNDELDKTLKSEKAPFDRGKDAAAYEKWVKDKTGETVEMFENQLRHLIQLEKLRTQVMDGIVPTVTLEEAHQEFLNEYNTLELELVQFDELKDAQDFYRKMQKPSLWVKEGKKNPKFAKRPGFVSLEFLINMWKIPKDDCYKMLGEKIDSIYPPTPIYKGYGVFRVLQKRLAEEQEFTKLKDSYFKQVELIKKYEGFNAWLKKLKEEAGIKVYPGQAPEGPGKKE